MNNRSILISIFILFVLLIGVVLLSLSLKKIKSTEYGLEYDRVSKFLDDVAKTGGLHTGPPGFKFIKFPSVFVTSELPSQMICVSQDGIRVNLQLSFQYQMPQDWLYDAIIRYRNFERWEQIVMAAGESAVQHSCSEFTITDYQKKRGLVQSTMEEKLKLKLEGSMGSLDGEGGVYAKGISVQLKNIKLPVEYENAVREKQSAEEDIALAINQRSQETTKADTLLKSAQEKAAIIRNTAENEAELLMTEARLKAEETSVVYEREAQVLLNIKNKLNLSNEGVLAYVSNEFYAKSKDLKVAMLEPVQSSWKAEL